MKSTDLPVTEFWDPEWDVYDVPLGPFDDGVEVDVWWAAYEHVWMLSWIQHGTEAYIPFHYQHQLTTGCRCREAPGWYPGRPEAPDCPQHRPHRCNVAMLGRSHRSEGCGWRCPTCRAEWTLTRMPASEEIHYARYGEHPRTQCGPAFCDLLPPYPTMQWTRDAPEGN